MLLILNVTLLLLQVNFALMPSLINVTLYRFVYDPKRRMRRVIWVLSPPSHLEL